VAERFEPFEILDGARPRGHPEAFGLGLVAQEEGPTIGVVDEAMEAFGQEVVAGMDLGDFHIAVAEFRADPDQGLAAAGEGLIEAGGEHAVFEAGGAEEGLLGGGDALDGEEILGVDGLVAGDEVVLEAATSSISSRRTTAKVVAVNPCLREFWAERALLSGERGPVVREALARLAASCLGESGMGFPSVLSYTMGRGAVRNRGEASHGRGRIYFVGVGVTRGMPFNAETLRTQRKAQRRHSGGWGASTSNDGNDPEQS